MKRSLILVLACIALQIAPARAALFGAGPEDTSEYLLGKTVVSLIFVSTPERPWDDTQREKMLEIRGDVSKALANWTTYAADYDVQPVQMLLALDGEAPDYLTIADVDVEPLSWARRESVPHWVPTVAEQLTGRALEGDFYDKITAYINQLRRRYKTDWGFVIFVLRGNSFADGRNHFVHRHGGPFITMLGDRVYEEVVRHEISHAFYALDEYYEASGRRTGCRSSCGYLNAQNANAEQVEGDICSDAPRQRGSCRDDDGHLRTNPCGKQIVKCLMRRNRGAAIREGLCEHSRAQLGWRDTDGDGVQDIMDTHPRTRFLQAHGDVVEGIATVTPYPNRQALNSPQSPTVYYTGTHRDISINHVARVEYSCFGQIAWNPAVAVDGAFDRGLERFRIELPSGCAGDNGMLAIRVTNQVGNSSVRYMRISGEVDLGLAAN